MGRHADARGLVLFEALRQSSLGVGDVVLIEHDLDDVDRGVTTACQRDRDVGGSP